MGSISAAASSGAVGWGGALAGQPWRGRQQALPLLQAWPNGRGSEAMGASLGYGHHGSRQ